MDLDSMTVKQLKELVTSLEMQKETKVVPMEELPFGPGDKLLIRTVTMILLGVVTAIGRDFIVMADGGWVAETARFSETLATGSLNEFERAPSWFVVGRGGIIDVYPWAHPIPQVTK
jgi:hypothetical protein